MGGSKNMQWVNLKRFRLYFHGHLLSHMIIQARNVCFTMNVLAYTQNSDFDSRHLKIVVSEGLQNI